MNILHLNKIFKSNWKMVKTMFYHHFFLINDHLNDLLHVATSRQALTFTQQFLLQYLLHKSIKIP